jgi:hypothetical protein
MNIPFTSLMSFQSKVCWQSIGSFFKCGEYTRESNAEIAAEINFAESTFITKMNPDELRRKLEYSLSKGNAVCRDIQLLGRHGY